MPPSPIRRVRLQSMTTQEFDQWTRATARSYAEEQISASNWPPEKALERALRETRDRLPLGVRTPDMLLLMGEDDARDAVGRSWVGLEHPKGVAGCAFLYDIEVLPRRRGQGWGRALLAATESETAACGALALELNVFGANRSARQLYASCGYRVITQQMRRDLAAGRS